MKKVLLYIGLTIFLTILGFLIRDYFFDFSFSLLDSGNVQLTSRTVHRQFHSHLLFSAYIGILPLLYFIVEKLTKVKFLTQGLYAIALIVGSGILLWQLRIFKINQNIKSLSSFTDATDDIPLEMNIDHMNFGLYLFLGFLVGTLLYILIYRRKTKRSTP